MGEGRRNESNVKENNVEYGMMDHSIELWSVGY
jgi:hypothetical protein